jgi:Rhs element Vgr protein
MANSPLIDSSGVLSCTVLSNGTALADTTQVLSVEISQSYNRIPYAKLTILDGDMPNATFPESETDVFKPGSPITIQAGYAGVVKTIFEGIVIKHAIHISGENDARLVIECKDKALAMTVGRKNANFVDLKDSDIISKLIGTYGGLSSDVTATDTQYKELVQFYCTDWDYMLARAEVNGLLVSVDAAKVSVKAPVTSGTAVLTVTYGIDLLEFQAELDSRSQLKSVQATAWDLATQAIVQQQSAPQTLNAQGNLDSATLANVLGLSTYAVQSAIPLESGALTGWSKAQQLKAGLSRIRGRMRFQGSSLAKVGTLIEVKGVGARFNGNVLVSGVKHDLREGVWTTEVEFGMSPNWFTEQEEVAARPAAGITAGVGGLQIGIVKKLDADPESQYKIQVSVPVMQAETDGVWARLANFYGSNSFGSFFIPEIGDEVILGYFNDDPSHPVILGSLYSSKQKAPYELTADNFTKAIITRSKLKVEFNDDKKIITIVTPGKNTIVISDDGKSILMQDQNNNKVELNQSGITLDSPKDIVVNAKGKITMSAVGNVEITAKADVKTTGLNINNNANVGFVAKGAATAELSASGQTTVKGAMVMIN